MKPTIHITNWPSRKLHGPGRKFTIMARPRHWERGDGLLSLLTPSVLGFGMLQDGAVDAAGYRQRYDRGTKEMERRGFLKPGRMYAVRGAEVLYVEDGDTICCACSRANAAAGNCHRVWAAEALARNGWRVVLDGEELAA